MDAYAILSFHKTDMIRLLQFPESLFLSLQPVILSSWPHGIQSSGPYTDTPNSFQIKLKGRPFGWTMNQDALGGARLVRDLFAFFYHHNYEIVMPFSTAQRLTSKDMLIFRPRAPSAPILPPREWLAIAPLRSDRLYIIGDSQPNFDSFRVSAVDPTPDHIVMLTQSITRMFKDLGLLQKSESRYNWIEYQLKGRPWLYGKEAGVKTRLMLLRLFQTLESLGWSCHTSVQHRTGNDDKRMLDTMFFSRPKDPIPNPSAASYARSLTTSELPSYSEI